jgi:hypothetical protein
MLRTFAFIACAFLGISSASAQEFCPSVRQALGEARTEFESVLGAPLTTDFGPELMVFQSTLAIAGGDGCVIAQQTAIGARFSTSLTCSNLRTDTDTELGALQGELRRCLEVSSWIIQTDGSLIASYGLLRLSITRHGARGGLALGVEAFRDSNGQVMGSPLRGDVTNEDGSHTCTPRSAEEIDAMFAMYGALPGAERFENDQFIGFTNRVSRPIVAFMTTSLHPAHPAIIVRDVYERDGERYVTASGDFAGDCQAFLGLLREVQEMNQNLGRR